MVEMLPMTVEALAWNTAFLNYVKPTTFGKIVVGVEKPKPAERSIAIHIKDLTTGERDVILLSAEFIADHPFWERRGDTK